MALFSKACLASSLKSPIAFTNNHDVVKPNLVELPTSFPTENWKLVHDHTLPSTASNLSFLNEHSSAILTHNFEMEHSQKVSAVKHVLDKLEGEDNGHEALELIDVIQRLGIDCYFQEEIDSILARQFELFNDYNDNDLSQIALSFRLLRQENIYAPSGVFDKYLDKNGTFKSKTRSDIKGLLSFYEASQLSTRGEDLLDEAAKCSYELLNSMATKLDSNQARLVEHTLKHPHHRSLVRFTARDFCNNLDAPNSSIRLLRQLAKLDFRMVQSQHQQEILQVSKWWRELGLSEELKFARDQPIKWYMWSMACIQDPYLSEQRVDLTKAISFIYILDDIFDVYGTLEDLTLFTQVVNGWDIAASQQLPYYMKICFNALDDIINEISLKIHRKHGWNPRHSLQKTWARLCNAFLVESKWFASGCIPSSEDYLDNGRESSGVHVPLVHIFFLLGQGLTKENVELMDNNPGIISSAATILRLWDDLGSAQDEDQDGNDGSYVECYMNEHKGISVKEAKEHVMNRISDEWKQLNEECLSLNNPFSSKFTKACLNIARMVPLMYNYNGNRRLLNLEEHMKFLVYSNVEEY